MKFLLIFTFSLLGSASVIAQQNPVEKSVEIPSPEVYSTIKVSNHTNVSNTGSTTVSVPLGGVSAMGHSIGATLNYSLSGIRASEISSNVGLGWNLDIGASLVRVVVGKPDENISNGMLRRPDLSLAMQNHLAKSTGVGYDPFDLNTLAEATTNGYDEASDIYKYNIDGLSGEFRFDHEGDVIFQPINNIKVEYDLNLQWIKLYSPSGKLFVFGGKPGESGFPIVDKSSTGNPFSQPMPDQQYINKWHLTEISDANGLPLIKVTYVKTAYESERIVECSSSYSSWRCSAGANNEVVQSCADYENPLRPGHSKDNSTGSIYVRVFNIVHYPKVIYNPHTSRSLKFNYPG